MPWGTTTKDNDDIAAAERSLDDDHFGLRDVKTRIIEFIAVNALKKDAQVEEKKKKTMKKKTMKKKKKQVEEKEEEKKMEQRRKRRERIES